MREIIIFDPALWPKEGYPEQKGLEYHIRTHNPPEAFWYLALPRLQQERRKAKDHWHEWWLDLSHFDLSLKGWKLVGRGDLPNSILPPGERPWGDKLAASLPDFLEGNPNPLDADMSEVGPDPTDLDIIPGKEDTYDDLDPDPTALDIVPLPGGDSDGVGSDRTDLGIVPGTDDDFEGVSPNSTDLDL